MNYCELILLQKSLDYSVRGFSSCSIFHHHQRRNKTTTHETVFNSKQCMYFIKQIICLYGIIQVIRKLYILLSQFCFCFVAFYNYCNQGITVDFTKKIWSYFCLLDVSVMMLLKFNLTRCIASAIKRRRPKWKKRE